MTKKEAIKRLINDFINRIIADDGFYDERDYEIAKALNIKELKEYIKKYE